MNKACIHFMIKPVFKIKFVLVMILIIMKLKIFFFYMPACCMNFLKFISIMNVLKLISCICCPVP